MIITDRAATTAIKVGGSAVILAVLGILVYLVTVVVPLFSGGSLSHPVTYRLAEPSELKELLFAEIDEYRALGVYAARSGRLVPFAARTGRRLAEVDPLGPGPVPTAWSRELGGSGTAFGFSDGTVRLGRVGFLTSFVPESEITPAMKALEPGSVLETEAGIVERSPGGELRRVALEAAFEAPLPVGSSGTAVALVDFRRSGSEARFAALKENGELLSGEVLQTENMLTGEIKSEVAQRGIAIPEWFRQGPRPTFLLLTSKGDQLYLAWPDGRVARFDLREGSSQPLVEVVDILPEEGTTLTAFRFMIGEQSILACDSRGGIRSWFRVPREGRSSDGYALVPAHTLATASSGVTAAAASPRDKSFLVGSSDGRVVLHHMTSEQTIAEATVAPPSPIIALQMTPKLDGAFAITEDGRVTLWEVSSPHPETTLKSAFAPVWYEGYADPSFTWQSSSGTDDFEPKFSLIPLIFGTLKATLYSMLFAVPISLFAAIYTSEFLDPRMRAPIKSLIEMMASLPSVVLGFVAALVLAPIVESWVLAVLAAFGIVPLASLAFGYFWQLLPPRLTLPLAGRPQFVLLLAVVVLALLTAPHIGGAVERYAFYGDFKAWLDGRVGTGLPGIAAIAWPVLFVLLLVVDRILLADSMGRRSGNRRSRAALVDLAKYGALVVISLAAALGLGAAGAAVGLDPRGEVFGTYDPRNALVVGFVMGFAVIPIIYTISEDALSSVPHSLRSASLGCGATRWQTATRIVLPVALPGIFSALMIGLGRAVGETMIVLMAAGNTPLIDMNLFNGLRTLSANIATELPEAVKDGTLYRMLFLAALCLFLVTFVVNSIAEIVRQRFRRRAFQL